MEKESGSERYDHERTLCGFQQKALTTDGLYVCLFASQRNSCIESMSTGSEKGTKTIVGRDWLTALRYKIVHSAEEGENSTINCVSAEQSNPEVELIADVKQTAEELPNLFERRGWNNNYSIKIEKKAIARVTQQKDRRLPIHLQKQVDKEIYTLIEPEQMEKLI